MSISQGIKATPEKATPPTTLMFDRLDGLINQLNAVATTLHHRLEPVSKRDHPPTEETNRERVDLPPLLLEVWCKMNQLEDEIDRLLYISERIDL